MAWKIRYRVAGGHVHFRLYVATSSTTTYAWCGGTSVVRLEEFDSLRQDFLGAEFVDDSPKMDSVCIKL